MKKTLLIVASFIMGIILASAQDAPVFHKYEFEDGAIIYGMSSNGKYAVAHASSVDNSLNHTGARLIEIDSNTVTDLAKNHKASEYMSMGTTDVTDDGSIVVGEFNHEPAFWSKATGKWELLPCEEDEYYGEAKGITPDGKYAVGMQSIDQDGFSALPGLWDMTTKSLLETPGIPTFDMSGGNQDQNWFYEISPDGTRILGCISFSYVEDQFYYIYDTTTDSFTPIGFTIEGKKFTPMAQGLFFINSATFSPDAQWVTGRAYMLKPIEGSMYPDQYEVTYTYNVASGEFNLYDSAQDMDIVASAIDNNGYAMAGTPSSSPIREWHIRHSKYWYSINLIMDQKFNMDFYKHTGYDNTGTPLAMSNDGRRVAVLVDPTSSSYVVEFPTTFDKLCEGVDLLGSYHVTPAAGSTVSRLTEITLTFDREIQLLSDGRNVEMRNSAGEKVYGSVGVQVNKQKATVRFRNAVLNGGEQYTMHIPAGTIALLEDATLTNKDINVAYNGRDNVPVAVTSVYPAEGSAIAKIDNNTNPIVLTFDTQVYLPDSAVAYMYQNDELEQIAKFSMAYSGSVVAIYPSMTQYLYKGNNYRIEVMPGSVTDVAGNGANEKIVINYVGSYEHEVVFDDNSLLIESFNTAGVANFMLWDGDRLQPNENAQALGFDRNDYGWAIAWDEEYANIAASSHSMYNPAGTSDDWMVVPQLYIPDDKCSLKFLSQSYLSSKQDYLKVYVWATDQEVHVLNENIIASIKSEGELIYNELQSPGSNDNMLEGDWKENNITLSAYAGKNVYIAFLNDNTDGSAVFVDDVMVMHNKPIRVAFTNATSVVQQENIMIEGIISIDSDTDVYNSLSLTLKDNAGNEIDNISESGLSLKKGDTYKFNFTQPLPLAQGKANAFTVTALFNETRYELTGKVSNLAFEPVKRVVLEEISGRDCSNCPLGFISIEKMEEMYHDLFIPICIRTFGGDPLGTGLSDYTSFLGLSSAPSAVINRRYTGFPAQSYNGGYYFSNAQLPQGADKLWIDYVADEFATPCEAEINISFSYDEATNELVVPCSVRYALDAENLNLNLFLVVLEDYVFSMQKNGFASISSEALGEWGLGGLYGKATVMDYDLMDVCRGYAGMTFNGTGGLLPQVMNAGEEYSTELRTELPDAVEELGYCNVVVMLIDANTGKIVNAARADEVASVAHVDSDSKVSITTTTGRIVVNTIENAQVEVYNLNGALTAVANGNNTINIDAPAGIAVVRVITGNNVTVAKVLVK